MPDEEVRLREKKPTFMSGPEIAQMLVKKYKEKKVDEGTLRELESFFRFNDEMEMEEAADILSDWRRGEDGPEE